MVVRRENLKLLLREIKQQSIAVAIDTTNNGLGTQFLEIEEIRDLPTACGNITILVACSGSDSKRTVIDICTILNLKLNKYLKLGSRLLHQISVARQNENVAINS